MCPGCRKAMTEVNLSDKVAIKVDVCQRCHFVWFDAGETKTLVPRPGPPAKPPIPQKAREAIALLELDRLAHEAKCSEIKEHAARSWSPIASFFFDV
jgi:Zn-finger nucleic acid-binding protein